jgi:hypothetical protein
MDNADADWIADENVENLVRTFPGPVMDATKGRYQKIKAGLRVRPLLTH